MAISSASEQSELLSVLWCATNGRPKKEKRKE